MKAVLPKWIAFAFALAACGPATALCQPVPEQVWQAPSDVIHRDGCPELSKAGGVKISGTAIGRNATFCPVCFPERAKHPDAAPERATLTATAVVLPETVWVSGHTLHLPGCPELRTTGGVSTPSSRVSDNLVRCSVCFAPGFKAPPRPNVVAQATPPPTIEKPRWWEYLAMGLGAFAQGYAAGAEQPGQSVMNAPPAFGKKIMIFGGRGHQTYLGCLSCNELQPDSIRNGLGKHGSSLSPDSIFNALGQFGSKFSTYSICNPYASDPPIIVDSQGGTYGVLTVNSLNANATKSAELQAFVVGVCAGR